GYRVLPRSEAMCRATLRKMGVQFVDVAPVGKGKGCGIAHPVKITAIAEGVAMKPAATLNCGAAVRISQWVEDEVKPAGRWKMWKRPTAVLNASSYRCSRIAGSRTVSEHASGNALDVRGFQFSDGSLFDVEKKGFFSFRQKSFQSAVRESACRYFGTVLGPGYNHAHRDHLHLDAKNRRRVVCK
ncbi:MAG TPA: extensin family protein, partial [Aurantimonas sp.]|nr:extensin family protein [Aurantimonas sp.]